VCQIDWDAVSKIGHVVAENLSAVAWPLLVLYLIFRFRKQLDELITALIERGGEAFGVKVPRPQRQKKPEEAPLASTEPVPGRPVVIEAPTATAVASASAPTVSTEDWDTPPKIENDPFLANSVAQLMKANPGRPDPEKKRLAVRQLAELEIALRFQRIFRAIYGSQIRLLQNISGSGNTATEESVQAFFKDQLSIPHNTVKFDEWIRFLAQTTGLLAVQYSEDGTTRTYTLTDWGKRLLRYLFDQAMPVESKPY
jgi:hypothetical protein